MSIETLLSELIAAVNANTAALGGPRSLVDAIVPASAIAMDAVGSAPSEDPKPKTKPKAAKPLPEVTKVDVQQAIVKLVNALGREAAGALMKQFNALDEAKSMPGKPVYNVTGLAVEHYAAALAEANRLVEEAKSAVEG